MSDMTSAAFTFSELTPTSFLARSAEVFADRTAVVDQGLSMSYAELHVRSERLTGVLADVGVESGDRVAALCTNSHIMLELHHGVPRRGAVLVPLNTRLSAHEIGYILDHSGAKALFATSELSETARVAVRDRDIVVVIAGSDYEKRLATTVPRPVECSDERSALAINYTSGTTGPPKGVVVHHRGAYLQSLALAVHSGMSTDSRYLWTLPMFHCNGWCLTWAVNAVGGTHICTPAVDPPTIWSLLTNDGITHFSAAPTVLSMIADAADDSLGSPPATVRVQTGGAPPSPALIKRLKRLNMDVTHLYGLTESFGPLAINQWKQEWDHLDADKQAELRARQGVGNLVSDRIRVIDSQGRDVTRDGVNEGEIVIRGNDVMLGYYNDAAATSAATTDDGWLRTGDIAVHHRDGYVEIRDRAKDVIISGGENIASVEVEKALDEHPAVAESAVVAGPDPKWGEIPIAYVAVRSGAVVTADDLILHLRNRLAGFKIPRKYRFQDLPKTATGKVRKQVLREQAAQ